MHNNCCVAVIDSPLTGRDISMDTNQMLFHYIQVKYPSIMPTVVLYFNKILIDRGSYKSKPRIVFYDP